MVPGTFALGAGIEVGDTLVAWNHQGDLELTLLRNQSLWPVQIPETGRLFKDPGLLLFDQDYCLAFNARKDPMEGLKENAILDLRWAFHWGMDFESMTERFGGDILLKLDEGTPIPLLSGHPPIEIISGPALPNLKVAKLEAGFWLAKAEPTTGTTGVNGRKGLMEFDEAQRFSERLDSILELNLPPEDLFQRAQFSKTGKGNPGEGLYFSALLRGYGLEKAFSMLLKPERSDLP